MDNLFRYGAAKNWELRLGGGGPLFEDGARSGTQDLVIAVKRHFSQVYSASLRSDAP